VKNVERDRRKHRSVDPVDLRPIGVSLAKKDNSLGMRVKASLV
jgi:hypothetical protein